MCSYNRLWCFIVAISCLCCFMRLPAEQRQKKASWTVLVYIAADNSLAPFASYNINDMSTGLASEEGINILVQWDKPEDDQTWRYKITPGGKIDVGTLDSEMGYDPEEELVDAMKWVIEDYPADHYVLVLWDHGSGIQDFFPGSASKTMKDNYSWLNILPIGKDRGILYDDTQKTCLTNEGLTNALQQIKALIGKNIDIVAMDACLMSMVEVVYQIKDLADIFVGSQQTIPGNGYPYSQFINPLSFNPEETTPGQLAASIVASYKSFYKEQQPTPDFTLAAIDVNAIELIKRNIDQFIAAINECNRIDAKQTKSIMLAARKASTAFEMAEYIDLYSLYANVLNQIKKTSPKSFFLFTLLQHIFAKPVVTDEYQKALDNLSAVLEKGLKQISKVVLQKVAGPAYAGVKGISIYYPSSGTIDASYEKTIFAQNSHWVGFVQQFSE